MIEIFQVGKMEEAEEITIRKCYHSNIIRGPSVGSEGIFGDKVKLKP